MEPSNQTNRIERIQRIAERVSEIPTLSPVMSRVVELADDPATSTSQLANFISYDQVITLKILKLANSAYYGLPQRIGTIDMAIVVLGFDEVKTIGLSVAVIEALKDYDPRRFFDLYRFWVHSVAVATGCRFVSRELKQKATGEVFVAGLVHDIGKLILSRHLPDEYARVMARVKEGKVHDYEIEDEQIGFTHAEVGGWLIKRWNLPDHQADAVYDHHYPLMSRREPNLAMLVNFADLLAWQAGHTSGTSPIAPELKAKVADYLKLRQVSEGNVDWEHYLAGLSGEMERAGHYLSVLYPGE